MTIRESVIEAAHRKIAQALGWMVVKLMQTAPNGMPDRIYISGHPKHVCRYCNRGRIVFVEWKRPGGVVSKQQRLRHDQLRAAGAEVYVVRSVDEANRVLGIENPL